VGERVRVRVIVDGRVQGVFFRDSARTEALRLGVCGWVRNLADGRVEAVFEGDDDAVASAVHWSHRGPPRGLVTTVETFSEAPQCLSGFEIRPT
jgi:acylphosphatase